MTKAINIRQAREKDIPGIVELYRQLAITGSNAESDKKPTVQDYRKTLAQINKVPGYSLLVAEDKGAVIGTVVLLVVPNLAHNACPWAIVENMIVDGKYRRKGIGKALMDYAAAKAREAGCYKLMLASNKKRRGAHQFYRSVGMESSSVGFNLYF